MVTAVISAGLHRIIETYFYVTVLSIPTSILLAYIQFKWLSKNGELRERHLAKTLLTLFLISNALLSFSFHSTIPLNIDRSFSVWMINQLSSETTGQKLTQVEKDASDFFSPTGGEILRRVNEQISLGNIKNENSVISLTNRGKRVWYLNQFISSIFGLNTKYSG
jgi:hypothetical protein